MMWKWCRHQMDSVPNCDGNDNGSVSTINKNAYQHCVALLEPACISYYFCIHETVSDWDSIQAQTATQFRTHTETQLGTQTETWTQSETWLRLNSVSNSNWLKLDSDWDLTQNVTQLRFRFRLNSDWTQNQTWFRLDTVSDSGLRLNSEIPQKVFWYLHHRLPGKNKTLCRGGGGVSCESLQTPIHIYIHTL